MPPMKFEVEYKIEEITRYRIVRTHVLDDAGSGVDFGRNYGDFDNRTAAELVKDALQARVKQRVSEAL